MNLAQNNRQVFDRHSTQQINQNSKESLDKAAITIKLGEVVDFDYLNSLPISSSLNKELKYLYPVECGEFFYINEDELEDVYQYNNLEVRVSGGRVAVMKIVDLSDIKYVRYQDLLIDKEFDPNDLNPNDYEIDSYLNPGTIKSIGIGDSQFKTNYDEDIHIFKAGSDDSLSIFRLNNQVVAVAVNVYC